MKHDLDRKLRRDQTDLERKLWYALRNRRFAGFKFHRQQADRALCCRFHLLRSKTASSNWMASNMDFPKISRTTPLAPPMLNGEGVSASGAFWNTDLIRELRRRVWMELRWNSG